MRRAGDQAPPLSRCRVSGSLGHTDRGRVVVTSSALGPEPSADLGKRTLQVPLDISTERPKRRDVDGLNAFAEVAGLVRGHELRQDREKGRQRLARAGGGRDEDMLARVDGGNGRGLRRGENTEGVDDPRADSGCQEAEGTTHRCRGRRPSCRPAHESPASSRTRSNVSISIAGLSSRTRTMRGKRSA